MKSSLTKLSDIVFCCISVIFCIKDIKNLPQLEWRGETLQVLIAPASTNYFSENNRLCKKNTQIWANAASLWLTEQIEYFAIAKSLNFYFYFYCHYGHYCNYWLAFKCFSIKSSWKKKKSSWKNGGLFFNYKCIWKPCFIYFVKCRYVNFFWIWFQVCIENKDKARVWWLVSQNCRNGVSVWG